MKRVSKGLLILLVTLFVMVPIFGAGEQEAATSDEPVTLTLATYHAGDDSWENFYETPVGMLIQERTGVNVQIVGKPAEVYQAMIGDLAADSLPDIMTFWAASGVVDSVFDIMVKAATEEMLAPLSQSIADHGPLITTALERPNVVDQMNDIYRRPEFDGELYIGPAHYSVVNPWISGYGLYIRGDVADKLNLSTPDRSIETTDDLYEILVKIKNAGIKDINGKPVYPIGSFTWDGLIFDAMGRPFMFGGPSQMGAENGEVKTFIEMEEAWDYILWMRKLVNEGLVDPEMFTDSYQLASEKVAQGRFAIWPMFSTFAVTDATAYIKAMLSAAPEMAYRPLGNMNTYLGTNVARVSDFVDRGLSFAVSKDADTDAAIRLINYLNTKEGRASITFGIEGEQFFWNDNGFGELYPEAYAEVTADSKTYMKTYGAPIMHAGGVMALLSEVTGIDSKYDVTGSGVDGIALYQNAPDKLDAMNAARAAVYDTIEVVAEKNLIDLLKTFPGKDQLEPVWNIKKDILFQSFLVDTEAEAREILEGYRETLKKNGYDDFIKYAQKEYDDNPGM